MSFIPGAFLGSLETVGRWVMNLPVPRFKGGRIQAGSIAVWKLFENRFGFTYERLLPYLALAFGVAVAVLFVLLALAAYNWLAGKSFKYFGNFVIASLVVLSLVMMPSPLLGQMQTENTCGGDVLASFETVGAQLAETVPQGATIYWAAGSVVTPLLYLTDVYVQPQLLNGIYSKRVGGDRAELERKGYYNQESVEVWRAEADYVINSNTVMIGSWLTFLNAEDFDEYQHTDPLDPCDPATFLRVFKKK